MATRPWPAPAKLNLFLHVVGRRADGYHLLQTVFQFLDLADSLHFEPTADGRIERLSDLPGVAAESDLVVRAARALQRESGCRQGVRIRVDKRIPMGGGLGGGSSDAATTLVALDRLWGTGLGEDRLAALGLALGADVPVFVRGRAAWGEGVGERLEPLALPEPWFLVLHPGCHVSTPEVFGAAELTRNTPPLKIEDFLAGHPVGNDCEPVVRARHPEVDAALRWLALEAGAPARLTGTGACVFAAFGQREQAEAVLRRVPPGWRGFLARAMNESPLRQRLAAEDEQTP